MSLSQSNGRVQVLQNNNYDMYKLFQDNVNQNNFHNEALKGIHLNNRLANVFFSQDNIDALQEAIRYQVNIRTCGKHVIDRQSDAELKVIMRAIYLQEAMHKQYDVMNEVRGLNTMVINYAVPRIIQEINMYMHYKQDINRVPVPLARGEFISSKGSKQLETKEF